MNLSSYNCSICAASVEVSKSYYAVLSKRNPYQICKKCQHRGGDLKYRVKYKIGDKGRECKDCNTWKEYALYPANGKNQSICKDCNNAKAKSCWNVDAEFTARTRLSNKKSHLMKSYGLTLEAYELLLKEAEYRCTICKSSDMLCVDHCHTTNKVRGILCRNCNKALGIFKDSTELLDKAKEYLHARSL
jgi:hypothetical protein